MTFRIRYKYYASPDMVIDKFQKELSYYNLKIIKDDRIDYNIYTIEINYIEELIYLSNEIKSNIIIHEPDKDIKNILREYRINKEIIIEGVV